MRRWHRFLVMGAGGLVVLFIALQWLLPFFAARVVEAHMTPHATRVDEVEARVFTFPSLSLLAGRVDVFDVRLRGLEIDGLSVNSVHIVGEGIVADWHTFRNGGGYPIKQAEQLHVTITLGEADLATLFRHQVPEIEALQVTISRGGTVFDGTFRVLGRSIEMVVQGEFQRTGDAMLVFVPRHAAIEGTPVPDMIMGPLSRELSLPIDLSSIGFPVALETVDADNGTLTLRGSVDATGIKL